MPAGKQSNKADAHFNDPAVILAGRKLANKGVFLNRSYTVQPDKRISSNSNGSHSSNIFSINRNRSLKKRSAVSRVDFNGDSFGASLWPRRIYTLRKMGEWVAKYVVPENNFVGLPTHELVVSEYYKLLRDPIWTIWRVGEIASIIMGRTFPEKNYILMANL